MRHLSKLLEISSGPITPMPLKEALPVDEKLRSLCKPLEAVLAQKNGFWVFDKALHFFHCGKNEPISDLEVWNSKCTWKDFYRGFDTQMFFFAEDVFGEQFGIGVDGIYRFEPECGVLTKMANDLDSWAAIVVNDPDVEVEASLAGDWVRVSGEILNSDRLLPQIFFILGGDYKVDNLYPLERSKGMQLRAELAMQLRNVPPGSKVKLRVVD